MMGCRFFLVGCLSLWLLACGAETDGGRADQPLPMDTAPPGASVTPFGQIGMTPTTTPTLPPAPASTTPTPAAAPQPPNVAGAAGAGAPPTEQPVAVPPAGAGMCCADGDCFCRGEAPTEAGATAMGSFTVESYKSGFNAGAGIDSYTVWYPTNAEPPFAGIAVVPGFVSPESSIAAWGPFLASHGIVAVTIGVPGGDQPPTRAAKLMTTVDGIIAENTRSGSPLEGNIDVGRMAIAGWSMGGGGAMIAASQNPTLRAAMGFAAWGPTGAGSNQVPVLMFEATADVLAANMSDSYYNMVPASVPKMLFEVQGSSHNVANDPGNHEGIIGRFGLSWLKVFLEGDERYRQFLTAGFPSIATAKSATNLE